MLNGTGMLFWCKMYRLPRAWRGDFCNLRKPSRPSPMRGSSWAMVFAWRNLIPIVWSA
jgi:hypothetical protein